MKDIIEPNFENMREMLIRNVRLFPKSPAIYVKSSESEFTAITYEQFVEDIFSLGTALINRGYKGKRIAVIGKNSYEWLVAYFATFCGVGTVVPLDSQLSAEELESALNRVQAEAIIYSKDIAKTIEEVKNKVPVNLYIPYKNSDGVSVRTLIDEGLEQIKNGDKSYFDIEINKDETLNLLFTSGTTSQPKIVMLSHKNIVFNIKSLAKRLPIYTWDRFYSILPFNHVLGAIEFSAALASGASIGICENLKSIPNDMKIFRPTFMVIVPRILETFVNRIDTEIKKKGFVGKVANGMAKITNITDRIKITNKRKIFHEIHENFGGLLRIIMVGGAPVNPVHSRRLSSFGIKVRQGYGLSECDPLVAVNGIKNYRHDSVGQPMPDCNVIIANPDENGIGEIAVKGEQVMNGYYEDQKSTAEVLKEDGYLYTGDLGTKDKKGYIRLTGRSKNLIVTSNGKNISPEQLEMLIGTNNIIKESVVTLEIAQNGKEILTAEIEIAPELVMEINNNPNKLEEITEAIWKHIKEVNSKVAEYKRIHNIKIRLTPFEITSTLKVKRYIK